MDTKFAKPAVSDETPPTVEKPVKPAEYLWCIKHDAWVKAELGVCGLGHVQVDDGETLDFCCFPNGYTFVSPPVIVSVPVSDDDLRLSAEEIEQAERAEEGFWEAGE